MIQLVPPSRGPSTQEYGNTQPDGNPHAGKDYGYTNGVEIFREVHAAADGLVLFAGDSRGLSWPNIMYLNIDFDRTDNVDTSAGNYTIIAHFDSYGNRVALTGYGHQEEVWVKAGDTVRAGQQIGVVGQTGFSAGKHLHFDLVLAPFRVDVAPYYGRVDPNPYFTGSAAASGSINYASDIITQLEEAGVALDNSDREFLQTVINQNADRVILDTRSQVEHWAKQVIETVKDQSYEVKAFVHGVDNANADRVILDNRAEEETTRAAVGK